MSVIFAGQSEAELLALAKLGESESFARLYDLYIKKIYNFIYYKTLNQAVAEDISSQVFLKAWQKLQQFKDGNFGAWLYTIARNAVSDHYRREKEHTNIDDCWDLSDKDDFLGRVDKNLYLEKIRFLLAELKREDREILIMRFWQDMSFQEIAERLDKQEGAVKMACGRALKKMKNKIPMAIFILLPGIINICKKMN
jgi:RNA polymerase sigma-70 factor (ECF subfamily)